MTQTPPDKSVLPANFSFTGEYRLPKLEEYFYGGVHTVDSEMTGSTSVYNILSYVLAWRGEACLPKVPCWIVRKDYW
jgi:hypothetical protein